MADELPEYAPRSLAIPLLGLAETPSGIYEESFKDSVKIRLYDQYPKDKDALPTLGRGSPIKGEVEIFRKLENVAQVTMRLEGFVKLDIYDGNPSKTELLSVKKVLYSKNESHSTCSKKLSFSFTFPTEEEIEKTLPPTFETPLKNISNVYGKVYYRLVVVLEAKRMLGMLDSAKTFSIDVNYYPRTSPPAHNVSSFENFDPSEDWHKVSKEIQTSPGAPSDVSPVICKFYTPASGTFGISDVIPFHVQLVGTSPAMDEFLPPSYSEPPSPSTAKKSFTKVKMKVTFMRKITIKPRSDSEAEVSTETTIGEASVIPLASNRELTEDGMILTDWGGEIRCQEAAVKTDTFAIEGLTLKDNLMLAINPQHPHLKQTKLVVPIRLVTDPWVDGRTNVAQMHGLSRTGGAALYGFSWG